MGLQCDSNELKINKFNEYIITNYNQFENYIKKTNQKTELSALNYMKYLINLIHSNQNNKNKNKKIKCKNNKYNDPISTEILTSIESEISEYLDDSNSMDYQDFTGCCREFIGDLYPERNIKIVYNFILKQQQNNHNDGDEEEIKVSFFLRIIAKF